MRHRELMSAYLSLQTSLPKRAPNQLKLRLRTGSSQTRRGSSRELAFDRRVALAPEVLGTSARARTRTRAS